VFPYFGRTPQPEFDQAVRLQFAQPRDSIRDVEEIGVGTEDARNGFLLSHPANPSPAFPPFGGARLTINTLGFAANPQSVQAWT
jgi:hypothetical protein